MSGSVQPNEADASISQTQKRQCDFCEESMALLYCRADSAKLCFSCDRQVHSTNQLFTKHTRNHLCDACDSSPASIFCSTDNAVLCNNCDWERQSSTESTLRDRRPLEGFTGCPSVNEILGFIGFEDLSKKALIGSCGDDFGGSLGFGFGSEGGFEGYSDLFVWETPAVVSLDDLILLDSSQHNFQAMGVPPLPKNRKAACGQYKEEILNQLRAMAISEPDLNDGQGDFESPDLQLGDTRVKSNLRRESTAFLSSEASALQWCSESLEFVENCLVPDNKKTDYGGGPSNSIYSPEGLSLCNAVEATKVPPPKLAVRELTSEEREYAISRYKEKKKTRRFEKQVRYESRRIRAESRTRVKGRFAKVDK